jgi:Flp pilus assembly pilin Flp
LIEGGETRVWKSLLKFLKDEDGVELVEYLVLAFLITGVVGAIVAGLLPALKNTHEGITNNVKDITGSGY